jgi:hypothetical protein
MNQQPDVTVNDLSTYGYARSFPGFWLRPNGLSHVSEQDALRELAEQLNNQQGAS